MPRLAVGRLAVVCVLLAGIGCGGDGGGGPNEIAITGTWDGGAIPAPGLFLNLTFTLDDAGGTVTGSGSISVPGDACPVSVTGTRDGDSFVLTLTCPGFQAWGYAGTATASLLNGKFNGSGFNNFQFTMARQ
jgi:hypothetical protein